MSNNAKSRHRWGSSGKKLIDFADIVIDNLAPARIGRLTGAASTVSGVIKSFRYLHE